MGFTKAFINALKLRQIPSTPSYSSAGTPCIGIYPAKTTSGAQRYIGPSSGNNNYIQANTVLTSQNGFGVNFSDDSAPYDEETVYSYPIISNLSTSFVSYINSSYTQSSYSVTARYNVYNGSGESITIRKVFCNALLNGSASLGSATSATNTYFLAFVQDLEAPVTIANGETAVIDVTFELTL